jgi:hypothetical protein
MDSLDELSKTSNGKAGFFKHVFNFNEDSKSEMLNIMQYAVLALIPIVIINKAMQRFVPEADDLKNSIELTAEIVAQVIVMFLGILIIHRIITYIPTYSGEKYIDFSVTNIILAVLIIVLSLQTKLGEKVSILVDRLLELWEGSVDKKLQNKNKNKNKNNVTISQPISQNQNQMAMNQSLQSSGSTSISALPPAESQQSPNYNQMYQQDNTPLIGAATPGTESFGGGIFAANDMTGGSFGSSINW